MMLDPGHSQELDVAPSHGMMLIGIMTMIIVASLMAAGAVMALIMSITIVAFLCARTFSHSDGAAGVLCFWYWEHRLLLGGRTLAANDIS